MSSPFTEIPESEWLISNELAFAFFDAYPVNEGHTLVVPRRIVPTWFEASEDERRALMSLVSEVKNILDDRFDPDGYNIGINAGEAAGQTVMHLHVHVIPRYHGDMDDPRGGVRHVIPEEGNYLEDEEEADRPDADRGEGAVSESIEKVADWTDHLSSGGPDDPFIEYLRPLFAEASEVDIVAAFIQDEGLKLLEGPLLSAIDRGAKIRVLTGDYLNLTQVDALQRLLDWQEGVQASRPEADPGEDEPSADSEVRESTGVLEVRVVEVSPQDEQPKSFHPKSWRFEGDAFGVAFVGSSNISRLALTEGIEWNLSVRRQSQTSAYREVTDAFESQWSEARPVTSKWVREYELRARDNPQPIPGAEAEAPDEKDVPTPHEIQQEALEALDRARRAGRERALVVHATGLGKTWLAAFDVREFADYTNQTPRVLFIAHRNEILQQAAETFRDIIPEATFGWYAGTKDESGGDIVFSSVQKLYRESNLRSFESEEFDYVIVDEVHHAAADSYRRILSHFDPEFLLGLTATPDRADEADIRPLFDHFVAHRADIGVGIEAGFLCPFHYHGLKDVTDYEPIPWRSGRFTKKKLTEALATQERMENIWEAMQEYPAERTIAFCSSIDHARYVRDWLSDRGVDVAAIYSKPDADDRDASLRKLAEGELDVVCAVDILNEGVDIPRVDRVAMLRPTESSLLFMQQLGRGLRVAEDKQHLTVLDFVGNHRVFLDRVRTLLSLGEKRTTLREFLVKDATPELPEGCKVDIELEAIELMRDMLPENSRSSIVREYRELREARGQRPTAVEMYRLDLNVPRLRQKHGSWFGFVANEGDLDEDEEKALEAGESWFQDLESTRLNKSFKMVVVQALLEADALGTGMPVCDLADRSHAILIRNPELFQDITSTSEIEDPRNPDSDNWRRYWDKWPLQVWAGDRGSKDDNPWFDRLDQSPSGEPTVGDFPFFRSNIPVPSDEGAREAFVEMTREIVEFKLARYRDRPSVQGVDTGVFRTRVAIEDRDPVLEIPSRDDRDDIPSDEVTAILPDGQKWRFRFDDETIEVARPVGDDRNRLPDLLRTWFGPVVGSDDVKREVEFRPAKDGWRVEPIGENVIPFPRPGHVIGFPDFEAAAGAHRLDKQDEPQWTQLQLAEPERADHADFAVRVRGDSMEHPDHDEPIRDGDWVLMKWARGESLGAVEDQVVLVEHRKNGKAAHYLKRVVETDDGFELRSDNPDVAPMPASEETVVIGLHLETLRPNDVYSDAEAAFLRALRSELDEQTTMDAYEAAFMEKTREWLDDIRGDSSLSDVLDRESGNTRLRHELADHLETTYELTPELGDEVAGRVVRRAAR
jgi:superfamily II DNA or RNA helicase/diadenosine tetraphosphate (Ap4A) HIT family hydrolase/HKD family nuclease